MNIGPMEMIGIGVIVLLLFGARKLPELARSAGKAVTEFKKGVRDITDVTIVEPPVHDTPKGPAHELPAPPPEHPVRPRTKKSAAKKSNAKKKRK